MSTTALARPRKVHLPRAAEILELAKLMYDGGLCNKHCNSPAKIAVRIVAGLEVGLNPVQSVNWIAVINGRAVIWGDAALALVRASGKLDEFTERIEGEGDDRVAICVSKRKGDKEPRETRFSVADAKKAKLWGKEGPWQEYEERQMMFRARGWNLRDNFNDVLCGLGIAEEEQDVPTVAVVSTKANPSTAAPDSERATPALTVGEVTCSDEQLERVAEARLAWFVAIGVDPENEIAVARHWAALLANYQVTSARQLSPERCDQLLNDLRASVSPKQPSTEEQAAELFSGAVPGN